MKLNNYYTELGYLSRYGGSGILNTIIGYAVIFTAMVLGYSAIASNISGYIVGFFIGFFTSKKFVFKSKGKITDEAKKYIVAFLISFFINLITLKLLLKFNYVNQLWAQIFSTSIFTISMYILTRYFVFKK